MLLTFTEVANSLPNRPSTTTIWRWCRKGIPSRTGERIRLEHVRVGGRVYVPQGALEAFSKALADADLRYFDKPVVRPVKPKGRSPKQRAKAIAAAKRELAGSSR